MKKPVLSNIINQITKINKQVMNDLVKIKLNGADIPNVAILEFELENLKTAFIKTEHKLKDIIKEIMKAKK